MSITTPSLAKVAEMLLEASKRHPEWEVRELDIERSVEWIAADGSRGYQDDVTIRLRRPAPPEPKR